MRRSFTRPLVRLLFSLACASTLVSAPARSQELVPAGAPTGPVHVRFETSAGAFTVELDGRRAPLSVPNFVQYVREGHYDGTIFHRVIGNFVVQGGGFTPDFTEKPTRPSVVNEAGNGLSNRRGTVAMARTEDPHSATSQFYVNLVDNLALDPGPSRWGYAVIGRVVDGMDVLDRISGVPTGPRGPFDDDVPLEPIVVSSARVIDRPAASPP